MAASESRCAATAASAMLPAYICSFLSISSCESEYFKLRIMHSVLQNDVHAKEHLCLSQRRPRGGELR